MGLHDLYEFDLFADGGVIDADHWLAIQHRLLELQPAMTATLSGDPRTVIRVAGYGGTEVAPGLLETLSQLVGTPLRVVVPYWFPDPVRPQGVIATPA